MGLIGRLLSFGARIAQLDYGAGDNSEVDHYSAPGDDAQPLDGDYAVAVMVRGAGRGVAVGYHDSAGNAKAAAGEKRIYARDSSGAEVAQVWLKADGTVEISNGSGTFTMAPSGEVDINGAKITISGDVVTALGVSLNSHIHVGNLGANTSPPVP